MKIYVVGLIALILVCGMLTHAQIEDRPVIVETNPNYIRPRRIGKLTEVIKVANNYFIEGAKLFKKGEKEKAKARFDDAAQYVFSAEVVQEERPGLSD